MRSHAKASSAIAAIGCSIFLACLLASPALAAKGVVGFVGGAGTQGGLFGVGANGPGGAAVNQNGTGGATAGDVYIVDRGNNRIQQFHADGTWVRAFGLNVGGKGVGICEVKVSCAAGPTKESEAKLAGGMRTPQGVAIEQSTGNVYVTDQQNRRIDVFSAAGAFEGSFGWAVAVTGEANELQLCTSATGCKAGAPGAGAGQLAPATGYPAISPFNGHLYVADKGNLRVDEFEPTITGGVITGISFVRAYGWGVDTGAAVFETCTTASECQAGLEGSGEGQFKGLNESPSSLAIDSTGRVYALDPPNNRVQAFSSTATPEGDFATSRLSGSPAPLDLGMDPSDNHLFAIKPCAGFVCPGAKLPSESRLLEFDSTGALSEAWAAKAGIASANGAAVASGAAFAYLTTKEGPGSSSSALIPGLFILGTLVPPAATIEPVSIFTGTEATFEGHVHTDTLETPYHFEYSADGTNWVRVPVKASEDITLPGDGAEHAVSEQATGLEAHTEYQVRLVAEKEYAGGSASAQTSFTTAASPPVLSGVSHSHLRDTSALLHGTVNPENEDTEYSFQYTEKSSYEAEGFNGAMSTPMPPGQLSEGQAFEATEQLSDLEPGTAYVYRLLASNLTGEVESSVGSFATYVSAQHFATCADDELRVNRPSGTLPDCRAYEQASPVDKDGGNVQSEYYLAKASPSGDRMSFNVVVPIPGAEGTQDFPTYVASRKDGSWSTQGVMPASSTADRAKILGWTPDFDSVFSWGLKLGVGTALFSRSSDGGALSTISPYGPSLGAGLASVRYLGSSADKSISFFNVATQLPVAPDSAEPVPGFSAGEEGNLYAWDRDGGELYVAGVLPDGDVPTKGVIAGTEDGYRIDTHAVAADGSVYFTDRRTGQLYRRINPTAPETTDRDAHGNCIPDPTLACTVHVSVSEKNDGHGSEGHDAAGSAPASFVAASKDGNRAIFTSSEKLTNSAYTGVESTEPPSIARADKADGGGLNGSLVPLADSPPTGIASDQDHLYWAEPETNSIGRSDLDGNGVVRGFITDADNPYDVAVDAGHLYWTNQADGATGTGTIGRADLNGDDPATNVTQGFIAGATDPKGIDVDADHVYWSNADDHIARADLPGGDGVNLEYGGIIQANGDVVVGAESIFFSHGRPASGPADSDYAAIGRKNLDGSGHQELLISLSQPRGTRAAALAVDGSHLYWTDASTGKVGRERLVGAQESFSTAVDSHGDLFVLNRWAGVSVFDPSGNPILVTRAPGAFSGEGSFSIAVDSQGNIYVVNQDAEKTVRKFNPSNPGSAPTSSTTYSLDKSIGESSPGANDGDGVIASGTTYAVAVDPSNDNVYVAEGDHISEYQPDGALVTNTIGTGVSGALYVGVDVYGANHNVYAADAAVREVVPPSTVASKAYVFSAGNLGGAPAVTIDGSNTPGGSLAFESGVSGGYASKIAVDQSNGNLYAPDDEKLSINDGVIDEFDASGAYLSQFPYPSFSGGLDLSVDNSGGVNEGVLYLASGGIFNQEDLVEAFEKDTHQRIASLSHNGYEAEPAFVTTNTPLGVTVDKGTGPGHLYWATSAEVPPNTGNDLYAYDSEAPEGHRLTDLAPENDGQDGIEVQGVLGASADASYVYFVANGVPDGEVSNSPNSNGEEAEAGNCKGTGASASGSCNLYLAHDGQVTFIAKLSAEASHSNNSVVISDFSNWAASKGVLGVEGKTARVSPDGQTLLFRSRQELTGYDNEGAECGRDSSSGKPIPGICPQLFRYRVGEGLTCVSCNPTGAAPFDSPQLISITTGFLSAPSPAPLLARNLSADGDRVFFETPDALVAGDTNADEGCPQDRAYSLAVPACQDVYEWEAAGAGSCPQSAGQQGCIYLLSTGKSPHPSFFGDAGESGDDAFIFTYSKLVRQDEDDQLDVYDAHVGGGLASQDALPPVACEGEACKGGTAPPPQSPSAGSESFSGSANPKPLHKKKAKKRKHAKKHRHAKKRHAKKRHAKKHHHRAKTNGRASR